MEEGCQDPRGLSQVNKGLQGLRSCQERLGNITQKFTDGLSSVLRQDDVVESCNKEKDERCFVPLADEMRAIKDGFQQDLDILESILDRLEL